MNIWTAEERARILAAQRATAAAEKEAPSGRGAPVTFERWLKGRSGHMNRAGRFSRFVRRTPIRPSDDLATLRRDLDAIEASRTMIALAEQVHGEWEADPYV